MKLPEHTTIHWHGQRLPNAMDGVAGLNQLSIQPGKTFVYEFVARRLGTFMYHPHADEMTQMAMGMMDFRSTHPKGTVAYEFDAPNAEPARSSGAGPAAMPAQNMPAKNIEVQVRKPAGAHAGH